MTTRNRVLLVLFIAIKLALILQFAAPAADFAYEGF